EIIFRKASSVSSFGRAVAVPNEFLIGRRSASATREVAGGDSSGARPPGSNPNAFRKNRPAPKTRKTAASHPTRFFIATNVVTRGDMPDIKSAVKNVTFFTFAVFFAGIFGACGR